MILRYVVANAPPPPPVPGWLPVTRPKEPGKDWIEAMVPAGDTPGDKDPRSCHSR